MKRYAKRLTALLLAVFTAALMLLTACAGNSAAPAEAAAPAASTDAAAPASTEPQAEKVVTMAISSAWDTFMPFNTTNAYSDVINDLVYDRLVVLNNDNTYDPRLAESWDVSPASDVVTFHLDPDAKWHDGTPVTADDVVYTCRLASDPDQKSMRRNRMMYYAGTDDTGAELSENSIAIVALDEHTVEFTLKTPMDISGLFALSLRDTYILPKHILETLPEEDLVSNEFWLHPIGSGPMKFDSMITGERVEFIANKDYHLGAPAFERMIVRVVAGSSLLAGMMSGEIDLAGGGFSGFPLQDWETVKTLDNVQTASIPAFAYQYMSINTSREYLPQEVRQAMNIAIDRDLIINQLLKGEGVAAISPLTQSHPYFNKALLPIEYDVDKAAQMVKDAGWDTSRVLEFLVPAGNQVREKSAPLIQQDLLKIGIQTSIQTVDFPTLLSAAQGGDYDILLLGATGSIDPNEMVPNVTVGSVNNFAQLTDPTIGQLGEAGAREVTFEARRQYYDEYQLELKKQVPMVFLYSPNYLYAYSNRLSNLPLESTNFEYNKKVWDWKVD